MWVNNPSQLSPYVLFGLSLLGSCAWAPSAGAQTIVTSATFTVSDAPDSTVEGKNFQNVTTRLASFVAGGVTYATGTTAQSAYVRRNGVSTTQSSVWYRSGSEVLGTHSADYGSLLLGNNVNRGSDNTFSNTTGDAGGNIERLDFVWNSGFTAQQSFAVAVFDRGVATIHDGFKVSLITGWDTTTNRPTSYSTLVAQPGSWVGGVNLAQDPAVPLAFDYSLFRYNNNDNLSASYKSTETGNQGVGGIVFNLSAFGVAPGTTIYGYSLFGYDVTNAGNSANLLDWTNTTYFPTTTDGDTGGGGIDLAAINGIAFSVVPEPSTYGLAAFAGLAGWTLLRRRPRFDPATA